MSTWTVYFVTRCNVIQGTLLTLCAILFLPTALSGIAYVLCSADSVRPSLQESALDARRVFGRVFKWLLAIYLLVGLGHTACPSSTEMAAILVLPKVANSEKVQGEARELYDLAKQWLTTQITPMNEAKLNDGQIKARLQAINKALDGQKGDK